MRRRIDHRGEEGIALLVVLLTITLLTIVVVEFTESAQVETHFALSERNGLQAYYLARSGVNVAEALLVQDRKLNKYDGEDDIWARPLPPLPVGDGTVALRVRDESRLLNINHMVSGGFVPPERRRPFERLFEVLGIDQRVLAAIADWLDERDDPMTDPPGAEQPYYLGMTPPVVVRNGPMLTMRELLQIRGMTPTLFTRLEEFVAVLPVRQGDPFRVNVNTAPAEVLYALSDGLIADPSVVDRLMAARREHPFTDKKELDDVSGWREALSKGGSADMIDTKSSYFRIDAVGEVDAVGRGITTLVRRDDALNRARITRLTWAPSTVNLSLTSQPPSDFLDSLPAIGGN
jgi:general secretion pathway protein K